MTVKESIKMFNQSLGIKTCFMESDDGVLGYAFNDTIYLNENADNLDLVNIHEVLHFYETSENFIALKNELLNIENIEEIREEYYLRYAGVYTKEEILNGVIDTEIAIDLMISKGLYKELLTSEIKKIESKRYLTMQIKNNVNNMRLSKWEKIFVTNYYQSLPQGQNKQEIIREDIKKELTRLYELANNPEYFKININSKDLLREYESEIKTLKARGEGKDAKHLENNKEIALQEMAKEFSKHLYEEYKHLVNYIANTNYEDAFKCLMLRETLLKTYKKDIKNEEGKTIVKNRIEHETIASHMILNDTVLDTIYNNVEDYNNFANLYFAGIEIYNNVIAKSGEINISNVNTYGMGHWIKFDGKTPDNEKYLENAQKLAALVQNTPWCTKTLASNQLADGDFYVFVDNNENPHIAVKMKGNEIDEVRGLKNDDKQELEDEYRKVALSFLEENKEIKYGKEWIEKEEWNKRLIEYNELLNNEEYDKINIEQLNADLVYHDYKSHGGNSNLETLRNNQKIKKLLAKYYNCSEKEIYMENIDFSKTNYIVVPYVYISGNVNFSDSQVTDLGNLTTIGGYANFYNSQITDLGNLTSIGGNANFWFSQVSNIGNLTSIGGNANFTYSQITDLGTLEYIGGRITGYDELKAQYEERRKLIESENKGKGR